MYSTRFLRKVILPATVVSVPVNLSWWIIRCLVCKTESNLLKSSATKFSNGFSLPSICDNNSTISPFPVFPKGNFVLNKISNVIINSIKPYTACFVTVNLNVGSTVKATFNENKSHGTRGVPLKAVIKWFIIL